MIVSQVPSAHAPIIVGYYRWYGGLWNWNPWTRSDEYQPTQDSSAITINVEGLTGDASARVKVDGAAAGTITAGGSLIFEVDPHNKHTFDIEPQVQGVEGERFRCASPSWTATDLIKKEDKANYGYSPYYTSYWYKGKLHYYSYYVPYSYSTSIEIPIHKQYIFTYRSEYYLRVTSEMGTPSGEGWYAKDATARLSIERSIPMDGIMGFLGGRYAFVRWTGAALSSDPNYSVSMSGPKSVRAEWRQDQSGPTAAFIAIGIAVLAIVGLLAYSMLRRRGATTTSTPSTGTKDKLEVLEEKLSKLEEEKNQKEKVSAEERLKKLEEAVSKRGLCAKCGASIPVGNQFCVNCGAGSPG